VDNETIGDKVMGVLNFKAGEHLGVWGISYLSLDDLVFYETIICLVHSKDDVS
jgi:hypothetical protein